MIGPGTVSVLARATAVRTAGFFLGWVVLSDGGPVDILPGLVAALAATGVSLALSPPARIRVRVGPLAEYAGRFLQQSVIAGADVARRALDPRLPVDPGFVRYRVGVPRGAARNIFTTLTSLLPGTVPIGPDERDALIIHCLDVGQPIAAQLAAEEALLARVIGGAPTGG